MAEGAVVRETVWRAGPDEALFIPEMWLRWAFSYDLACAGKGLWYQVDGYLGGYGKFMVYHDADRLWAEEVGLRYVLFAASGPDQAVIPTWHRTIYKSDIFCSIYPVSRKLIDPSKGLQKDKLPQSSDQQE